MCVCKCVDLHTTVTELKYNTQQIRSRNQQHVINIEFRIVHECAQLCALLLCALSVITNVERRLPRRLWTDAGHRHRHISVRVCADNVGLIVRRIQKSFIGAAKPFAGTGIARRTALRFISLCVLARIRTRAGEIDNCMRAMRPARHVRTPRTPRTPRHRIHWDGRACAEYLTTSICLN